jgi:hypothetical protein
MASRLRRWVTFLLALVAVAARIIPGPRIIDDAYITFRYAQNLTAGRGLVFNLGEPILGTTTPLYSLLLGLLALPFGGPSAPYPQISWILNAGLDAIAIILIIALGRKLGSEFAGFATAAVWAVAPMSVTFAIGGMETSLTVLLLLAAFYLHLDSRPTPSAWAASLALLARPDALLFVAPLALERARQLFLEGDVTRDRSRITSEALAFFLPVGAWTLFATIYYGSPITHSVAAKVATYRLSTDAALVRLLQHYATPFLGHKTFGLVWIAVGLVLFPILHSLGSLLGIRHDRRSWPLFVSPWIYFLAFSLANPLIFRWYLTPPLPFYFMGIFLGGQRLANDLRRPWPVPALALFAVILTLRGWDLHPDHGPDRPAPEMAFIKLELLYEQVGRELVATMEEGDTVAAADIGAVGYFTGAPILDTLGLVTPRSLDHYPADESIYAINYAIPNSLIRDLEPDHLIILEVYGRRSLLLDSDFVAEYRLVDFLPTDIYGSRGMMVFSRANTREP